MTTEGATLWPVAGQWPEALSLEGPVLPPPSPPVILFGADPLQCIKAPDKACNLPSPVLDRPPGPAPAVASAVAKSRSEVGVPGGGAASGASRAETAQRGRSWKPRGPWVSAAAVEVAVGGGMCRDVAQVTQGPQCPEGEAVSFPRSMQCPNRINYAPGASASALSPRLVTCLTATSLAREVSATGKGQLGSLEGTSPQGKDSEGQAGGPDSQKTVPEGVRVSAQT